MNSMDLKILKQNNMSTINKEHLAKVVEWELAQIK